MSDRRRTSALPHLAQARLVRRADSGTIWLCVDKIGRRSRGGHDDVAASHCAAVRRKPSVTFDSPGAANDGEPDDDGSDTSKGIVATPWRPSAISHQLTTNPR